MKTFEDKSGIRIDRYFGGSIGEAARLLHNNGMTDPHKRMLAMANQLETMCQQARNAAVAFGHPEGD